MARKEKKMELTENGRIVLESRYLQKDGRGMPSESPEELFERVARAVASVEKRDKSRWNDEFCEMMLGKRFFPNTPTLLNAGKESGQLSACYVLPIVDSLEGIFDTLKYAALIHQSGGGTGFSFSRLRQKGASVQTTHGTASGPVSFMKIYDTATEAIKQGGARRGANMGVLSVHHPDILEFINSKRNNNFIQNFNISVGISEIFMRSVILYKEYSILDPRGRGEILRLNARDVFGQLARAAWECGDPGLVFLDRMNQLNPTPKVGQFESTNPCGEQPLLPFESCNLGSINVLAYLRHDGQFDWENYREDIRRGVRFLDNVIDLNIFPLRESEHITRRNRKIGLGVMGFADLLLMLRIPYDSEEGRNLGESLMSVLDREAKSYSARLAEVRGGFPNWRGSLWDSLGYPKLRNATVSTVAPTGTISMIAGVSSGIEPIFSASFFRNVLSGARLREIHLAVRHAMERHQIRAENVSDERISEVLGTAWSPAQKVSVEGHVKMQAVFQRHSDSAVSKTINLPQSSTVQDVEKAYLLAYQLGCKGITVYRDKSRATQVLEQAICETCNE